MSKIKGTNVSAPIVPFDSADTFGTHDAQYGIGGYRSVLTVYDRDAIPAERRYQGMRVRVTNDNNALNNTDWDYIDNAWVKSITVQQAETARDAAIAAKTQAETARDAAQLSAGVYDTTAAGLAATTVGDYFSVPSDDLDESLILYRHDAGPLATEITRYPSAALVESLIYSTDRTFYVTKGGLDTNSGTSLRKPLATIKKAVELAALVSAPCVIIVHPGEYFVEPDTVIPPNCALYGYDLRVTKLILDKGTSVPPSEALKGRNMFQMSNGIKIRGFTFTGLEHEDPPTYITYPSIAAGISATNQVGAVKIPNTNVDSYIRGKYFKAPDPTDNDIIKIYFNNNGVADLVDHDYPPEGGFSCVFKPGEFITRSPYIGDCSNLHSFTYDQMTLPINRAENNPNMPRGGGNLRADGSILNLNSPLKSVVVDSFTAINPNGYGYLITRGALVQLVSVFTNWSRIGVWCHQGGQVTIANSNTTFGDYALASTGYRYMVKVPETDSSVILGQFPQAGAELQLINVANEIVDAFDLTLQADNTPMTTPVDGYTTFGSLYQSFTESQKTLTKRDAHTLLRQLAYDLIAEPDYDRSGSDRSIRFFIGGLFDWNANAVFAIKYLELFNHSFDIIVQKISDRGGVFNTEVMQTITNLIDLVKNSLISIVDEIKNYPILEGHDSVYRQAISSIVEATGQQLSYAGTGVNYNSLPYTQRGTGSSTSDVFIKSGGGKIYATFATEIGDTYLGEDLRVDFERSTIEGQAFSRGVQNITLPLAIGIGG